MEAPAVFAFYRSSRPVLALGALVGASLLATDSITIRSGDTLSELAVEHGVTVSDLMEWNDIGDPDLIVAGTSLIISSPSADAPPSRYVVQAGDTLSEIAEELGVRTADLADRNDIADRDLIRIGQTLVVTAEESSPAPAATAASYVVAEGDTLSEIAEDHGLRTAALAEANAISNRDHIRVGQTLTIPGPTPTAAAPSDDTADPAPTSTAPPTTTAPSDAPSTTAPPTTAAPTTAAPTAAPPTTTAPAAAAGGVGTLLTPLFAQWSQVYGVDQGLVEAIAWQESDWRPGAVGPNGHLGIAQLSPDTVTFVEERLLGLDMNPLDASDGVRMAARYLRYLSDQTGSEREAVAAWNQGLASVQNDGISAAGGAYADAVLAIRDQRG